MNRIEIELALLDVFSVFLSRKMESSVVRTSESEWGSEEEIPRLNPVVSFTEHLANSYAA